MERVLIFYWYSHSPFTKYDYAHLRNLFEAKTLFDRVEIYISYDDFTTEEELTSNPNFAEILDGVKYRVFLFRNHWLYRDSCVISSIFDNIDYYKDSYVFFTHAKGNYTKNMSHDEMDLWINLMWYENTVHFEDEILTQFEEHNKKIAGTIRMTDSDKDYASNYIEKSSFHYSGSFCWLNINAIIDDVKRLQLGNVIEKTDYRYRYFSEEVFGTFISKDESLSLLGDKFVNEHIHDYIKRTMSDEEKIKFNDYRRYKGERVALCTIVKNENAYIREWVEYYTNLGVCKFFIYDNNGPNGEKLSDVIGDYIGIGLVKVIPFNDLIGNEQKTANNLCYAEYRDKYDWFGFIDVDEFISINGYQGLTKFLSSECFSGKNMVLIPDVYYSDNGYLRLEGEESRCNERFTEISDFYDETQEIFVKSFLRGGIDNVTFLSPNTDGCHIPYIVEAEEQLRSDIFGSPIVDCYLGCRCQIENSVHLKHFSFKTAEEFASNKVGKSWPDTLNKKVFDPSEFFMYNTWTQEKQDIIDNILYK